MLQGVLAIAIGAVVGLVQPGSPDFGTLVERLDSENWLTRESATEAIGSDAGIPMEDIAAAFAREDLSAEQRARLWRAAINRFRMEPKGGLGVSFGSGGEGGVRIDSTVPGFPAAALLRAGDTIVSVDGGYLSGQAELRAEILSRRPGESMRVLVRRDRELLELDLPLGAYSELTGAALLDDATTDLALRIRLSRRGIDGIEAEPVAAGLGARAWIDAAFPEGRVLPVEDNGERRDPAVVLGGSGQSIRGRGRVSFWSGAEEAIKDAGDSFRSIVGRLMTAQVRLRSVMVEFERSLTDEIARVREAGGDITALEGRLEALRERMRAMDEALGETARRMDRPLP